MSTSTTIRRALISVSNKTNIVAIATALHKHNIEILSTGGTAKFLKENHIPVTDIADYTGFPEMMEGRLKTLHPKIHGGLLGRRGIDEAVMQAHNIPPIDLLIVNLYPFSHVIAKPETDLATAIENIDIGGPTLLRAAAKNYEAVTVIVDPNDYELLIAELDQQAGSISAHTRFHLAKKVFAHTAQYDATIANYLNTVTENKKNDTRIFPEIYHCQFIKKQDLRYGENPHQHAAFYRETAPLTGSIAQAEMLQGKALSFNNITDADAAWECVKSFTRTQAACVIVKHANPCGVAIAENLTQAYQRAFATDPDASFGGIIAFNQPLSAETAQTILRQQFVEVIIAPQIADEALVVLAQKPNVRVLAGGDWPVTSSPRLDYKRVNGGLLIQDYDDVSVDPTHFKTVTERHPTSQQLIDLYFAWQVVKHVKSNAIVYAKNNATVGIGAGQMSRVYSAQIAAMKAVDAKLEINGAVMASDAFFPFADSIDTAAKAGISAIIQPGGSIRDDEVIAAANAKGIAMVLTGYRHFRH